MTIKETKAVFERCKDCVRHTSICDKKCNECDFSSHPSELLDAYNTAIKWLDFAHMKKGFEDV